MLAHNCAISRIGFNFDRLYEGADVDYELALHALWTRVNQTYAAAQAKWDKT